MATPKGMPEYAKGTQQAIAASKKEAELMKKPAPTVAKKPEPVATTKPAAPTVTKKPVVEPTKPTAVPSSAKPPAAISNQAAAANSAANKYDVAKANQNAQNAAQKETIAKQVLKQAPDFQAAFKAATSATPPPDKPMAAYMGEAAKQSAQNIAANNDLSLMAQQTYGTPSTSKSFEPVAPPPDKPMAAYMGEAAKYPAGTDPYGLSAMTQATYGQVQPKQTAIPSAAQPLGMQLGEASKAVAEANPAQSAQAQSSLQSLIDNTYKPIGQQAPTATSTLFGDTLRAQQQVNPTIPVVDNYKPQMNPYASGDVQQIQNYTASNVAPLTSAEQEQAKADAILKRLELDKAAASGRQPLPSPTTDAMREKAAETVNQNIQTAQQNISSSLPQTQTQTFPTVPPIPVQPAQTTTTTTKPVETVTKPSTKQEVTKSTTTSGTKAPQKGTTTTTTTKPATTTKTTTTATTKQPVKENKEVPKVETDSGKGLVEAISSLPKTEDKATGTPEVVAGQGQGQGQGQAGSMQGGFTFPDIRSGGSGSGAPIGTPTPGKEASATGIGLPAFGQKTEQQQQQQQPDFQKMAEESAFAQATKQVDAQIASQNAELDKQIAQANSDRDYQTAQSLQAYKSAINQMRDRGFLQSQQAQQQMANRGLMTSGLATDAQVRLQMSMNQNMRDIAQKQQISSDKLAADFKTRLDNINAKKTKLQEGRAGDIEKLGKSILKDIDAINKTGVELQKLQVEENKNLMSNAKSVLDRLAKQGYNTAPFEAIALTGNVDALAQAMQKSGEPQLSLLGNDMKAAIEETNSKILLNQRNAARAAMDTKQSFSQIDKQRSETTGYVFMNGMMLKDSKGNPIPTAETIQNRADLSLDQQRVAIDKSRADTARAKANSKSSSEVKAMTQPQQQNFIEDAIDDLLTDETQTEIIDGTPTVTKTGRKVLKTKASQDAFKTVLAELFATGVDKTLILNEFRKYGLPIPTDAQLALWVSETEK